MFARMVAARAFGRRFGALVDIAADKTEPTDRFVAFPHRAFLNLFLIASKTTFVTKLNLGNRTEMFGNLGEAFRLGDSADFLYCSNAFCTLSLCSLS